MQWNGPRAFGAIVSMAVLLISISCGGGGGNKQDQPSITSFTASPTTPIAVGANAALQAGFKGGGGIIPPGAVAVSSGGPVNGPPTIHTPHTLQVTSRSNVVASATAAVVVEIVTTTLGPSGGVIKSPAGVTVEVPFGALDQPTQLSVSATTLAPPAGI